MDQPDREVEPQFSHPVRQIMLMLIVLGLSGVVPLWPCRAYCRCFRPIHI